MAQHFDRKQIMRQTREILRDAQVSPRRFFALFLVLDALMTLANYFANLSGGNELLPFSNPIGLFVSILVNLLNLVLIAGCRLYSLAIRRGERAEYLTLFDGFSFVGKVILLNLAEYLFIFLWSLPAGFFYSAILLLYGDGMLFMASLLFPLLLVPPLVAMYRYRFAIFNLCEKPDIGVMEAISLSKRQTFGCKRHLVLLDLSFAGWFLLSYLPAIAIVILNSMSLMGVSMPAVNEGLSLTAQLLFPMIAGVLYLPRYYTAEAGYYETAVSNTGVRPEARNTDQGPDNLGGYF